MHTVSKLGRHSGAILPGRVVNVEARPSFILELRVGPVAHVYRVLATDAALTAVARRLPGSPTTVEVAKLVAHEAAALNKTTLRCPGGLLQTMAFDGDRSI